MHERIEILTICHGCEMQLEKSVSLDHFSASRAAEQRCQGTQFQGNIIYAFQKLALYRLIVLHYDIILSIMVLDFLDFYILIATLYIN